VYNDIAAITTIAVLISRDNVYRIPSLPRDNMSCRPRRSDLARELVIGIDNGRSP
jgi:hypothetical protein